MGRSGEYLNFGMSVSFLAIGWEAGHSDRLWGKIVKRKKKGESPEAQDLGAGRHCGRSCAICTPALRGVEVEGKPRGPKAVEFWWTWMFCVMAASELSQQLSWLNQDLIFLFLCCLLAGVVYWLKLFPYGCNVELDYIKRGAFLWHCSAMERSSLPLSPSNLPFLCKTLGLERGTCSGITFLPLWGL